MHTVGTRAWRVCRIASQRFPMILRREQQLVDRRSRPPTPAREPSSRRSLSSLKNAFEAVVTCHPGLENVLSQELRSLSIQHGPSTFPVGIALPRVTLDDLYMCHLRLGTASRILLRCCPDFSARALGELQRKLARIVTPPPAVASSSLGPSSWIEDIVADGAAIHVKAAARKSRLYHTGAIEERVMEIIQRAVGSRASVVDRPTPDAASANQAKTLSIYVYAIHDVVSVWMDTASCSPLHQRGYRLETGKAPLREDLSFALLYSAGWRPKAAPNDPSLWNEALPTAPSQPPRHLLDPFCGSGTIAIEAAGMSCGLPPGRLRPAPFQGMHLHDPCRWHNLVRRFDEVVGHQSSECLVHGSDRDEGAIAIANANARRAGVLDAIDLRHCAFSAHPFLEQPDAAPNSLLIVSNLPFGRRLLPASVPTSVRKGKRKSTVSPLLSMYQRLADRVGSLNSNDVSLMLLTDDQSLVKNGFQSWRQDISLRTSHGGVAVQGIGLRGP